MFHLLLIYKEIIVLLHQCSVKILNTKITSTKIINGKMFIDMVEMWKMFFYISKSNI